MFHIHIDKSGANKGGIKTFNKQNFKNLKSRQFKYLNNIVEQDHRNVKRRITINIGFKDFESAQRTLEGIEIVNIIRKNQIKNPKSTMYKTFYSLTAYCSIICNFEKSSWINVTEPNDNV